MKTTVKFFIRIFNPNILSFINDTGIRKGLLEYYRTHLLKEQKQKKLKEEVLYNLYAEEAIGPEDVTIRLVDEESGDTYTFDLTDKITIKSPMGRRVVIHSFANTEYPITCAISTKCNGKDNKPIPKSVLGYNPITKRWRELFCFHENIILN